MVSRRPGESAPTALRRAADPAMTANASLADREACTAAGMNDHVAKPIDKERLVLCLLGHLGRSGARSAPATAADAGELVEARGDIVGRFRRQPGADRPGVAALRSGHAGPLRPARTPARRGRCRGSAATLHTIKAALPPLAPAPPGRPCQRAGAGLPAPIRGAVWKSSPASASTNCAPCAMPACSACRRCSATCRRSRRAEPGAVACPAKDSGGPGARLHPLRPVGRITPWALSADTRSPPRS